MATWKDYLKEIYYDPKHPAAFSGPTKLHKVLKNDGRYNIGVHKIRQWLQDQDSYSLQQQTKRKFKRNRVISDGIDALWDVDLADVSNLAKYNDKIKFLLIAIDVFSRCLWVITLKDRKHGSIIKALETIFSKGRKPTWIRSDKGSEFANRWVKTFLNKSGIGHSIALNTEIKANYAERVIRSLRAMMFRYFTYKQTYEYVNILQDLVYNYNHRPHRSLGGKSPNDVNASNEATLWKHMYMDTLKPKPQRMRKHSQPKKPYKKYKFKIGDYVRLTHIKHPFQRDHQEKWTEELFIIKQRFYRAGIPTYKVTDYAKDVIEGRFYQNELQKVNKNRDDLWRIDKVLKKRKQRGKEEVYVSFVGWPKKYNMWIAKDEIQDI